MIALGDYIVAVPGKRQSERKGIVLPESAQQDSPVAEVVAVGDKVENVVPGDHILIPLMTQMRMMQTHVVDFFYDEKPAIVVKEEDVAVIWPAGVDPTAAVERGELG